MNRELAQLLAQAGYDRALRPNGWTQVVVVHNYGSVPPPPDLPPDFAQKGFKLLLLDESGTPTHFARCGSATDQALIKESAILETLCRIPEIATAVPETRSAASNVMRVQVSRYLPGRTYDQFVIRDRPRTWARRVLEIMEIQERVTTLAASALPQLATGGPVVSLREEAGPRIEVLRQAGFDPDILDALTAAFTDVTPLPRRYQHGDLWPGNVIWQGSSWHLIDFAEFAHVQVPSYDLFHMLHYNPGSLRMHGRNSWLTYGDRRLADEWTDTAAQIAGAWGSRLGITPAAIGGTLIYYLVHLSAYRLREGVPRKFADPYLRELRRVGDALRGGTPLEALL